MSKILAVFGATGTQGGAVVKYVSSNPKLNKEYKIRSITRNTTSEAAQKLKEVGEVVEADISKPSSLEAALQGVHTVFAVTTPVFEDDSLAKEFANAKGIADAAVAKGVKYYIWSTLPAVTEFTGGKHTMVTPFDAKAKTESYIRTLPMASAFVSLGYFMQNFFIPFMLPVKGPNGTYVLSRNNSPKTRLPYIDSAGDAGKFVGVILAAPEKYEGKVLCSAVTQYSWEEVVEVFSKTTGKKVVYKQISNEEYQKSFPFPASISDIYVDAFDYQDSYGYYGPGSEELVKWAAEQVPEKLTTLQEFFAETPLQLE